ncbi:hypothetical protein BJX76DRAFT_181929 [Aspergillus varians]
MPQGLSPSPIRLSVNCKANQRLWLRIDTQNPTEHKEGIFEKIFDHHHHHHNHENDGNGAEDHGGKKDENDVEDKIREDVKKDEGGVKDWLKREQELEDEGQTYGGLM